MGLFRRDHSQTATLDTCRDKKWPKISDYGIIGDSRSAALVNRDGGIDWLCWPRFDSASIFAALLDRERGGHWTVAPSTQYQTSRHYVSESNVLATQFHTSSGSVIATDLMPVSSEQNKHLVLTPDRELVRQVECTEGEVEVSFTFLPRANYGKTSVKLKHVGELGIKFEVGNGVYWLRSSAPLHIKQNRIEQVMRVKAGDRLQFSLTYSEQSPVVLPPLGDWTHQRICESIAWWQQWAARVEYDGPHRDAVVRSALALKLLAYAPSGAVIAAATTSLPEQFGGSLNWDYRYCWLRDASLTIRALLGLGFHEEVDSFFNWMMHATRLTQPELRVLYTVFGRRTVRERALDHLTGYRNSRPVRIGNAAHSQMQLDVYGEVIDAAAQYAFHRGVFDRETQRTLVNIGRYVASHWDQPDQGIWEPRDHPENHTHSRVLCWTALDRLVTMCERGQLKNAPADEFRRERDRIVDQVKLQAWNADLDSYVSTLHGNALDASLLLMSYYGFESADSPRMRATYNAIRKQLRAGDHLLYRYKNGPKEGAFGLCSFWEVDFLALGAGSLQPALNLFDDLLKYRNDLGLFAEEIDPQSGDALGNFPQAFTHVGLISAALSIAERLKGEKQLAHREDSAEEKAAA